MPEGVEVRLIAESIVKELLGRSLVGIEVLAGRYLKTPIAGMDLILEALPARLDFVGSKGKFIWFKFVSEKTHKAIWALGTLGLTGAYTLINTKHSKLSLIFANTTLYLFDIRNFATIKFTDDESVLNSKLSKLGLDMFSPEWTSNNFITMAKKSPKSPIAEVLLSQKCVSGPGTYIVAESLYCAQISPHRKISSLSDDELATIHGCIKEVATESYNVQTLNINNLGQSIDKINKYKFKIYGRKKDDYGNVVTVSTIAARSIKWVAALQH